MLKQMLIVVCSAALLGLAGCGTPGRETGAGFVDVTVSSGGRITVGGRPVALGELPGTLRSAGATPNTGVRVSVPEGVTRGAMAEITRTLSSAGFRRILFTAPTKTESFVSSGKRKR